MEIMPFLFAFCSDFLPCSMPFLKCLDLGHMADNFFSAASQIAIG